MAYDCLSCGACCTHGGEVVVWPEDDVPKHLTRSVRDMIGFGSYEAEEGYRRMARSACGACKAMGGKDHSIACRIYDRRPTVCREFEPGSDVCLRARKAAGID